MISRCSANQSPKTAILLLASLPMFAVHNFYAPLYLQDLVIALDPRTSLLAHHSPECGSTLTLKGRHRDHLLTLGVQRASVAAQSLCETGNS